MTAATTAMPAAGTEMTASGASAGASMTSAGSRASSHPHAGTVTDHVLAMMARQHIPGLSVAVTSAERVLFAAGFGTADLAAGTTATAATHYLWFSLTKIATATAAMHLIDEGRLDPDEPVSRFFPTYTARRRGPQPTIRHLLNHTAGAANPIPVRWVRPADRPAPEPAEFLAGLLGRHPRPEHDVGAVARYSNLGYLMLAEVIAEVAGQPFTDHVEQRLLRPLGMSSTGFDYSPGAPAATGYVRVPRVADPALRRILPAGVVGQRAGRYLALNRFLVNGAGYGGLVGTVTEAARLAALHLGDGTLDGHRLLRADTARAMREVTAHGKPFDVGVGWFHKSSALGTTVVEHLGGGGGFFNAMRLYPDLGIGIVTMANTTSPYDHAGLGDTLAGLDWRTTPGSTG